MERSQTCSHYEKRPVRVSVHTVRNGVKVRVDLCAPCSMEWRRSGKLPQAETEKLGASVDPDLECGDLSDEATEMDDVAAAGCDPDSSPAHGR